MVKVSLSRRIRRSLFKWLYTYTYAFSFFFVEYQHDDNITVA